MDRRSVIRCVLALLLAVYLGFALVMTRRMARNDRFDGDSIVVVDPAGVGFVTKDDIRASIARVAGNIDTLTRGKVDTSVLESSLRRSDLIESVQVVVLNNGRLLVTVVPMTPVARVFARGTSYYINAEGKRIGAESHHHVDVPLVVGDNATPETVRSMLPMFDYIKRDPVLDALVSSVSVERDGDIILVPMIHGHVVNMGDTSRIADKFRRLLTMYRKVMPVKGWNYYDTLSVKWEGQLVATRRQKRLGDVELSTVDEFNEIDDNETMLPPDGGMVADSLAPPLPSAAHPSNP